jgi:hypothetical protein
MRASSPPRTAPPPNAFLARYRARGRRRGRWLVAGLLAGALAAWAAWRI